MLADFIIAALSVLDGALVVTLWRRGSTKAELDAPVSEPDGWLTSVLSRRIIIHTRDDQSIEGSLMGVTADGLILRAAQLLQARGQADTPMAGEVFVPAANVAFAQFGE